MPLYKTVVKMLVMWAELGSTLPLPWGRFGAPRSTLFFWAVGPRGKGWGWAESRVWAEGRISKRPNIGAIWSQTTITFFPLFLIHWCLCHWSLLLLYYQWVVIYLGLILLILPLVQSRTLPSPLLMNSNSNSSARSNKKRKAFIDLVVKSQNLG